MYGLELPYRFGSDAAEHRCHSLGLAHLKTDADRQRCLTHHGPQHRWGDMWQTREFHALLRLSALCYGYELRAELSHSGGCPPDRLNVSCHSRLGETLRGGIAPPYPNQSTPILRQ